MTLIRPPQTHHCDTPFLGFYEPDTLWRCDECQRWWYARDRPSGPYVYWASGTVDWFPVTWWNIRLRKRIERGAAPGPSYESPPKEP
jgi:hypothetical protein